MVGLNPEIEQLSDQIIAWRREFHRHPESSLKEYETADRIQTILTDLGIPYEKVGETGTLGRIEGSKSLVDGQTRAKTIFLRADIDALEITEATGVDYASENPGLMHACGHDAHTAGLLGAAKYLNDHRDLFAGTVLLGFQQAEEIGAGAKQFVQSGLLKDVDQCFGIHVDPFLEYGKLIASPGSLNASCDIFTIEVEGKSCHVAAPDNGIDALVAGANIVTELQNIVARQVSPKDSVVVGIGRFNSGTRYNIIANHAKIEGTLRTISHESRVKYLERIEAIAQATASIHGAKIKFSNYGAAAPVINTPASAERGQAVAAKLVGDDQVIREFGPLMGGDDFADYLAEIPGLYGRAGVRSSEATSYSVHHEKFNLDERALPLISNFHVDFALDYLNDTSEE